MKFPYIFDRFSFNFLVISWILAFALALITYLVFLLIALTTGNLGPSQESDALCMLALFVMLSIVVFILKLTQLAVPCLILLEFSPKFRIKNQKFLNLYNNIFIRVLTVIMAIMQIGCCIFALIGLLELFDYI